ncbi:glycosyltransferase [Parafrankia sp. FMc2]|uniref:glycosyltransferase n=1 Tax=Parafrankia sp. FMc2 TaxID=3233196 RepID=UPI0034D4DC55
MTVTAADTVTDDAAALPRLSVIISCRNSAATLAQTLESIAAQAYPGWWEMVVVDNGSTDNTADVARGFTGRLPHLQVVRPPEPGHQAHGVNHGIAHSSGEVIVFLDSDDIVGPDYMIHMARAMTKHGFVGARVDVDRLNPPAVRARRRVLQGAGIDTYCGFRPAAIGAAMGGRRDAIDAVGGMDPELPTQHDLDVSWRMAAKGCPTVFVPDAVLHYRYRVTARDVFRQERGYGFGEVALYRKFRADGMPGRSLPQLVAFLARLALALPGIRTAPGRARVATMAGMLLGRIEGSISYRRLYL